MIYIYTIWYTETLKHIDTFYDNIFNIGFNDLNYFEKLEKLILLIKDM